MSDINKGIFTGRIAKKEVRTVGELTIVNVSLAVNYYDRKEKTEKPLYLSVSIFGKDAEYLNQKGYEKGDQLTVEGEFRPEAWVSRAGENHYALRLSAERVVLGRKKGDSAGTANPKPADAAVNDTVDDTFPVDETLGEDDLPF